MSAAAAQDQSSDTPGTEAPSIEDAGSESENDSIPEPQDYIKETYSYSESELDSVKDKLEEGVYGQDGSGALLVSENSWNDVDSLLEEDNDQSWTSRIKSYLSSDNPYDTTWKAGMGTWIGGVGGYLAGAAWGGPVGLIGAGMTWIGAAGSYLSSKGGKTSEDNEIRVKVVDSEFEEDLKEYEQSASE